MKNSGKTSEKIFDDAWKYVGKAAHVFAFVDSAKATGLNGRKTNTGAQPSDRILTYRGHTSYAEIKSSVDPDAFKFSLLRTTQGAFAAYVLAAGGSYDVYFHSLPTDRWFKIPYKVIWYKKQLGKGSIKLSELEPYLWYFPIQ